MEQYLRWLAGFIDGDGCFSIPVSVRSERITIGHQVRIALKENDDWILKDIQKNTNIGKVYYSNKGKPNGVCSWQTTNIKDAINITECLIPYLLLKKEKAIKFLEAIKIYRDTRAPFNGKRKKGVLARDKSAYKKIIKIATELNNDRQTKRYREYKNYDYWIKKLDELW